MTLTDERHTGPATAGLLNDPPGSYTRATSEPISWFRTTHPDLRCEPAHRSPLYETAANETLVALCVRHPQAAHTANGWVDPAHIHGPPLYRDGVIHANPTNTLRVLYDAAQEIPDLHDTNQRVEWCAAATADSPRPVTPEQLHEWVVYRLDHPGPSWEPDQVILLSFRVTQAAQRRRLAQHLEDAHRALTVDGKRAEDVRARLLEVLG